MLTKMNIEGDSKYLDITELADGVRFERLCFVVNDSAGTSKLGTGYFTFYVKDKNANILRAQLFDVKDFVDKGLTAKALVNKPVMMKFMAQIYNGRWSLIIESIETWNGDFDYSMFRGSVDCDATQLKSFASKLMGEAYQIPHEYSTVSFPSICDGRCGGYMKLMDATMRSLMNYKNLPTVEITQLLEVFFYTMEVYYDYLLKLNKFPIIPSNEIFNILNVIEQRVSKNPLHLIIADSCRSVVGVTKPQHIYAHLIMNAIKQNESMFSLIYTNASLTKGSLTQVGGVELLRF